MLQTLVQILLYFSAKPEWFQTYNYLNEVHSNDIKATTIFIQP
jgi:hypothetical protein